MTDNERAFAAWCREWDNEEPEPSDEDYEEYQEQERQRHEDEMDAMIAAQEAHDDYIAEFGHEQLGFLRRYVV